jgi:hypothetical protein
MVQGSLLGASCRLLGKQHRQSGGQRNRGGHALEDSPGKIQFHACARIDAPRSPSYNVAAPDWLTLPGGAQNESNHGITHTPDAAA